MRKFLLILGCFLSLGLVGASSTTPTPDFQSLYESYASAVREMNVDAYMGFFADEFHIATSDGRELDRAELTEAQRAAAKATHVNSFEVTVQSVTPTGAGEFDVVVLQNYNRDLRTGNTSLNLRNSVVRHEIWRNTDAGWKIMRVETVLSGPTARHVRHWL